MVFLEDPITIDLTSRCFQTEEEEAAARQLIDQYKAVATIEGTDGNLQSNTVVFLVGPAAALLASTFFRQAKAIGSISVPELQRLRSPYDEEYGSPTIVHTSTVLRLTDSLAVVASERFLPPEQAVAWAAAVMGALQPAQVVVASTIAAMDYRGPGSPADGDLIFSLQTPGTPVAAEAAAAAGSSFAASRAPAPLPPGTLLGGLPAALLSLAARQRLPAAAVVGVQLGPAPDAMFVRSLAEGVQGALGACLGVDVAPHVLAGAELLAEIRAATDRMYRSSASNSIFV